MGEKIHGSINNFTFYILLEMTQIIFGPTYIIKYTPFNKNLKNIVQYSQPAALLHAVWRLTFQSHLITLLVHSKEKITASQINPNIRMASFTFGQGQVFLKNVITTRQADDGRKIICVI